MSPRHPPCQPIMRYISGSEGPGIDILGNEIFAKQRGSPYICFFCAAKVNTDLKSAWTLNLPFLPKANSDRTFQNDGIHLQTYINSTGRLRVPPGPNFSGSCFYEIVTFSTQISNLFCFCSQMIFMPSVNIYDLRSKFTWGQLKMPGKPHSSGKNFSLRYRVFFLLVPPLKVQKN